MIKAILCAFDRTPGMKKKRILFLSPYPYDKAPSQRLKYEQYYPHIESSGYEITCSSFVSQAFWKIIYRRGDYIRKSLFTAAGYLNRIRDLFRLGKYDVVYVHLWVTPIGPPVFEWLVRKLSKKIIYDIDDLVYLNDKRKNNKIMLLIRGKTKPLALMRCADHVICCTPRLEEFVRRYNDQVTDISSTINTDVYIQKENYSSHKPFVIGWSGSHSTSRFLHLLAGPLRKLSETQDFVLKVIGDPDFEMEGVNVNALAWHAASEVTELSEFDIGIYPLPLDEEWVYGKSGLKALQYMALGIPTVATAIGSNFRIIENSENGFLVENEQEWIQVLSMLIGDEDKRSQIGRKAASFVRVNYSVKANSKTYLDVISSLT